MLIGIGTEPRAQRIYRDVFNLKYEKNYED